MKAPPGVYAGRCFQRVKEPANRQNALFIRQQFQRLPCVKGAFKNLLSFDRGIVKMLAAQGVLTYCANRTLPYHLYADGSGLLVLTAPLTSASLSKITF